MSEYTYKYGHNENDAPGKGSFEASSDRQAMEQARKFVADGYRNGTWINMTLSDGAYQCRNEHGNSVGERTRY